MNFKSPNPPGMRNNHLLPVIQSIIHESGITVMANPSIDHPIPVPVFYRNSPNGSVCQLWPKGNSQAGLFRNGSGSREDLLSGLQKYFLLRGFDRWLAHGRLVLYADLPTATYLQSQWRRN
jgi:hypothetical protein